MLIVSLAVILLLVSALLRVILKRKRRYLTYSEYSKRFKKLP